jgi:hypothetical protein
MIKLNPAILNEKNEKEKGKVHQISGYEFAFTFLSFIYFSFSFCFPFFLLLTLLGYCAALQGSSWKDVPVVIMSSENVPSRISMYVFFF